MGIRPLPGIRAEQFGFQVPIIRRMCEHLQLHFAMQKTYRRAVRQGLIQTLEFEN